MRVGVFAHRLSQRQATGIGRFTRELVGALASTAAGDEIVVASTREPDRPAWLPEGVEARVLRWPRKPVQAAWFLGAGPRLEHDLGAVDVVHLVQPFPPVPTRAPQIATVHDLFPYDFPEWYPRSEQLTYRRSMQLLLRRVARITVPSRYVAERVQAVLGLGDERVCVVPLGVSGTFSRPQPEATVEAVCRRFGLVPGGFAVSIGAVSTRKNVQTLVRAFAELGDLDLPLVVVGPDGFGASDVDAEIARLDGGARALRTGYLDDASAAALVQSAALLLHPCLGEGFGFVPLEAMAAGTPVIAAGACSVPEVTGDAAVLIEEPVDPEHWRDAVAELMSDADRRASMALAGRERARAFDWTRTAAAMLDIYREVASR